MIEIWEPKWKERLVLVSVKKVKSGKNYILFTQGSWKGRVYSFDGEEAMKCDMQKNGKVTQIDCYRIPLYMLKFEYTKNGERVKERTEEIGQMVLEEMRF